MTINIRGCMLLAFWGCTLPTLYAQKLHFEQDSIHIGCINEDDQPVTCDFVFQNPSHKAVRITKIKTTCSCAKPTFKKGPILPGEKGKVSVTFFPLGRVGEKSRPIQVFTDASDDRPACILTLAAKVMPSKDPYIQYPYQIGALRLMQSDVHFGRVKGNQRQMTCIEVVNTGAKPLTISVSELPPYLSFTMNPQPLPPHGRADLVFIVHPNRIKGDSRLHGHVVLEGVGEAPVRQRTMNVTGELIP